MLDDGEYGARDDDDGEGLEVLRVLWMMQGREVVLVLIVVLVLVLERVHDGVLVILVLKFCLHGFGGSATAVTLKICDWARMPVFILELDTKLNWYPVLIGGGGLVFTLKIARSIEILGPTLGMDTPCLNVPDLVNSVFAVRGLDILGDLFLGGGLVLEDDVDLLGVRAIGGNSSQCFHLLRLSVLVRLGTYGTVVHLMV